MNRQPLAIDLFSGAGGASRGTVDAGFEVPFGVDNNPDALQSYNESLPGDPILADLSTVDLGIFPDWVLERVVWLHGSPPCQGLSYAGYFDRDDERNQLIWTFVDWVDAIRPPVVTLENVAGMAEISSDWMDRLIGDGFSAAQQQTLDGGVAGSQAETRGFRSIGYRAKWRVLNSANYGVPQNRDRIFLVAVRDDFPTPDRWFPERTHARSDWRTARDAIDDLAEKGRLDVANHVEIDHNEETVEMFQDWPQGYVGNSVTDRRLDSERPGFTVTASDGNQAVHYDLDRRITAREAARIQSFPDDHVFVGSKESQINQIGNAVPPRLQQNLASHVMDLLESWGEVNEAPKAKPNP